jgi:hypothetical protein
MFSFGFGAFIFLTTAVVTVAVTIYRCNKEDNALKIRLREIELEMNKQATERAKIDLEKGKLKASGGFTE